jgi:hypothetical protein
MVLRIRYKKNPTIGFKFRASADAVTKGDEAARKELMDGYYQHMKRFRYMRQIFGEAGGKDKITVADVSVWIEDNSGNKIETIVE